MHLLVGGLQLGLDVIGPEDGRSVLLVHGFATSRAEMWQRLGWYAAFERKGYRLVAADLRGHGDSAKPHDPAAYAPKALLGDLFGLLDHFGIAQTAVLGYSLGGRLALQLASQHPERVSAVIAGGVGGRLLSAPAPSGAMAAAMEAADPATITEPMLRSFRHFAEEQGADLKALAAFSRAPSAGLAAGQLECITAPCRIIAGMRDHLAGDPHELAAAIPGAQAQQLPGCDHFSAIAHGLFKASVFDFLDGDLEI